MRDTVPSSVCRHASPAARLYPHITLPKVMDAWAWAGIAGSARPDRASHRSRSPRDAESYGARVGVNAGVGMGGARNSTSEPPITTLSSAVHSAPSNVDSDLSPAGSDEMIVPALASQISNRARRPLVATRSRRLSGENETDPTLTTSPFAAGDNTDTEWPVRASHTRAVPSSPAVATSCPSGLQVAALTLWPWPVRVRSCDACASVHARTVLSVPAVSSTWPSGLNERSLSSPRCPRKAAIRCPLSTSHTNAVPSWPGHASRRSSRLKTAFGHELGKSRTLCSALPVWGS